MKDIDEKIKDLERKLQQQGDQIKENAQCISMLQDIPVVAAMAKNDLERVKKCGEELLEKTKKSFEEMIAQLSETSGEITKISKRICSKNTNKD